MSTSIDPRAIYADAKASDPEQILIFRVEDSYVLFDADAKEVARPRGGRVPCTRAFHTKGQSLAVSPENLIPLLRLIINAGRRAAVIEPVPSAGDEPVERIVMEGQP